MKATNFRRSFASGLLLALVVPMIAACGGSAPTAPAATTAPAPAATAAAPAPAATAAPAPAAPTAEPAPAATAAPTSSEKILKIHQNAYPDVFDPQKSSYSAEIAILIMNYEGLTRLDKDLKSVPAAAESWKFNDAGDEITFTLRDGLKYSDGSPLTSKNFQYAIERNCNPETAGEYQSILFEIKGCAEFAGTAVTDTAGLETTKAALLENVATPDDKTITFKLTNPAPYFPYLAGLWVMFPAKQELITQGGPDWWKNPEFQIGNGPFQITTIEEDQLVSFKANENYWSGKPKIDGIDYVYINDSAVALEAYRSGQLDIMNPDPSQLPAIKADAELSKELGISPGANVTQMQYNLTIEPFNDLKMREAFAYAFDRQTYCEEIRSGDCLPALSWIPNGIPGSIKSDKYAFDPAKAKEALAASKYGSADKVPEITMAYASNDAANKARHEWIAGQIRDVLGIELKLEGYEAKALSALKKDVKTYPQLSLGGWIQDYPDPQNWLSVYWLSSATFAKRVGYANEEFDKLTKAGDIEKDPAKRVEFYQQAGQVLVDTQAGSDLYNRVNKFLVKPYVTGYDITASDDQWFGQWSSPTTIDITK